MKEETKRPDGNDFQYKVKKSLENIGWVVRMSPYYNDSFSEKPREIDIIAEKAFNPAPNSIYNCIAIVRLFIECKYIAEQTVFWLQERNLSKAKNVVDATGSFHPVDENFYVQQGHHYLANDLVAKLYRTEGKNPDGDPIYKAITQCLNATIYYRNHSTDLRSKMNHISEPLVDLNYPLIVCTSFDKISAKNTTTDSAAHPITKSFEIEVDYAYTKKSNQIEEMFYVDVLNVSDMSSFENDILLKEVRLAQQKSSDDERMAAFHRRRESSSDYNPFDAL